MKSPIIIILLLLFCLLLAGWGLIPIASANEPILADCRFDSATGILVGTSATLRSAIDLANRQAGPDTIHLAPNCNYGLDDLTTTTSEGKTNLPVVTGELKIAGFGATLRRASGIQYRMLLVEEGVKLTIENATFENGFEFSFGHGGAIFLRPNAHLILENVNFKNNRALLSGGAISATFAQVTVHGGFFENNRANTSGGAITAVGVSTTAISETTFIGNEAGFAGALFLNGSVKVEHNEFVKNKALTGDGGAVYIDFMSTDVFLTRNKFFENQASNGGGAYIRDSRPNPPPTLGHVHIYNNLWVNQIAPDTAHLFVQVVSSNTKSFSVHYNTFVGSQPVVDGSTGVSLHEAISGQVRGLSASIFNNVFVDHDVALENAGLLQLALQTNLFFNNQVNFTGNFADVLNIEADPLFSNPTNPDFHPGPGSKAIDAATDKGIDQDLDGQPRPQGNGFDIGAFEITPGDPSDDPETPPTPEPDPETPPTPAPGEGFSIFLPVVVK